VTTRTVTAVASAGAVAIAVALVACTASPSAEGEAGTVVAVVDGDTIDVAMNCGGFRVRLIGIDSPEIGRKGQPSDCYAEEARDYLDRLLYSRSGQLITDASQGDTDRYGRLLRHVLVDGDSAAVAAVEAGAGTEYTYDTPYAGHDAHERAHADAAAGLRDLLGYMHSLAC
jgi:micrococcal nuclease